MAVKVINTLVLVNILCSKNVFYAQHNPESLTKNFRGCVTVKDDFILNVNFNLWKTP